MKKIGDFLEKFTKLAQASDDAKSAIAQALKNAGIRYSGDIQTISIRGTVATLKLTPAQKSEVFLKQKRILAELAQHPLAKKITIVR